MSNWMIWGAAALVLVIVGSYLMPKGPLGYEVRALTAAEMKSSGALVVDIRRPEEWAQTGVIPGAKRMTFQDANSFVAALGSELTEGRPLVLVCQSGRRTAAAASALARVIPNPIISQDGGMGKWTGQKVAAK